MWSIHFINTGCYKMAWLHLKSCLCELGSPCTHTHSHTNTQTLKTQLTDHLSPERCDEAGRTKDESIEAQQKSHCRLSQKVLTTIWTEVVKDNVVCPLCKRFSLCGTVISCHVCRWLSGLSPVSSLCQMSGLKPLHKAMGISLATRPGHIKSGQHLQPHLFKCHCTMGWRMSTPLWRAQSKV